MSTGGNVIYYPLIGGGGSVTSVSFTGDGILFQASAGVPVTTAGTLTPVLLTQSPNTILAGPATGSNATPTFRGLVPADIDTPVVSFAAPSVVPAVSGSTTWGYVIVARQNNLDIAVSTEGKTTTGTATLSAFDYNVITWAAVPGAQSYDIYLVESPHPTGAAKVGYLATVNTPTLTYSDTVGNATTLVAFITPSESGFFAFDNGVHIGMSWLDLYNFLYPISTNSPTRPGYQLLGYTSSFTSFVLAPTLPAWASANFYNDVTAGAFFASSNGQGIGVAGTTAMAYGDNPNIPQDDGIVGVFGVGVYNSVSDLTAFTCGGVFAGEKIAAGSCVTVGCYGIAINLDTGGTNTAQLVSFFADTILNTAGVGTGASETIGYYVASSAGVAYSNYGFYAEDFGTGANDYGLYIAGNGKSYFSGPIIQPLKTPNTSGATGVQGQIEWDTNYIYVATATNTWVSIPIIGFQSGVTGTGALVLKNTPTFITPVIGAATGTSLALSGAGFVSIGADVGISQYASGAYLAVGNGTAGDTTGIVVAAGIQTGAGAGNVTAGPFSSITSIAATGGIVSTLTGTSDERLKTHIVPFERGLAAILNIDPKIYQWNKAGQKLTGFKPEQKFAGFIAQNVQQAIPEAVGREGDYLSLDTRPILAALVNAVKELSAKVIMLEQALASRG